MVVTLDSYTLDGEYVWKREQHQQGAKKAARIVQKWIWKDVALRLL